MFISIGLRLKVEVEALNMVEAMGAYSRHRTASILKPRGDGRGYRLVIAPAVSGQAVAYGYMKSLVDLAARMGLPICDECRAFEVKGGFLKHGTAGRNVKLDDVVRSCVVEDVTGFMVAEANIRRTSAIMFSYMVPDVESSDIAIDPQFHVRAPMPGQKPQPFQVEAGTAVYTLGVAIDIDKIGRYYDENGKIVELSDRVKRVEAALKALAQLVEGLMYGAKKARYLPIHEAVGGVAAVSKPIPFMVSPPRVSKEGDYITKTVERAKNYIKLLQDVGETISILYMDNEGVVKEAIKAEGIEVARVQSIAEMIGRILGMMG